MALLQNITSSDYYYYKVAFYPEEDMGILDLYPYENVKERYSWYYLGVKIIERFKNDPVITVIGLFYYLLLLSLGNGSLFLIMSYEKMAMDPQKRTILSLIHI